MNPMIRTHMGPRSHIHSAVRAYNLSAGCMGKDRRAEREESGARRSTDSAGNPRRERAAEGL